MFSRGGVTGLAGGVTGLAGGVTDLAGGVTDLAGSMTVLDSSSDSDLCTNPSINLAAADFGFLVVRRFTVSLGVLFLVFFVLMGFELLNLFVRELNQAVGVLSLFDMRGDFLVFSCLVDSL